MSQTVLDGYDDTTVFLFEKTRFFDMTIMEWVTKWQIVGSIPMFIEQASSTDRLIAAQRDVNIVYIAMWKRGVPLEFDDKLAFRNKETQQPVYVKITTVPMPNRSESMEDVIQAQAEIWLPPAEVLKQELPNDE